MAAVTSGTNTFSLDVDEIVETALDPLGGEHQSGISAAKARRILNLLLIQMQNKEIPLSKIDFITQAITAADAEYTLDAAVKDILECTISVDSVDQTITRMTLRDYHQLPNKTQTGRPNSYIVERGKDDITVTFWPVPDTAETYTAKFMVAKLVEDITASYQKIDISTRYLPLITKWLSYELAISKPGIPADKILLLKAERDEVMPDTFLEDRERIDFTIKPGGISGR